MYDANNLEGFIETLATMLFRGEVTPRDIYETMMEVNNQDHATAMHVKERAMVMNRNMERHATLN